MRAIRRLVLLVLSAPAFACHAGDIPVCEPGIRPTSPVAVPQPHRTVSRFVGWVRASLVIESTGAVKHVVITSSDLRQHDRGPKDPADFKQLVISAISKWRYAPRPASCRHQVDMQFKIDQASRSNNSFKPNPLRGSA